MSSGSAAAALDDDKPEAFAVVVQRMIKSRPAGARTRLSAGRRHLSQGGHICRVPATSLCRRSGPLAQPRGEDSDNRIREPRSGFDADALCFTLCIIAFNLLRRRLRIDVHRGHAQAARHLMEAVDIIRAMSLMPQPLQKSVASATKSRCVSDEH